jgi:hypothetical protein
LKSEKEKIYLATIYGAQHVTNNLLNELQLVDMEIKNHGDFDKGITSMFDTMQVEAKSLMKELSTVADIDENAIKQSIYPK